VPLAIGVGNAKVPLAATLTVAAPFERTSPLPARPVTVPPRVKVLVLQLTTTLATSSATTLPVPPLTLQTWAGDVGFDLTLTS
jgi:hypothetical protein